MSTKTKKVTLRDPVDDSADYLEPLEFDLTPKAPSRTDATSKASPLNSLFSSVLLPITLLLFAGIPICQFVIGLIYIGQCTVRQFISTYMILSGACGIAFVIVGLMIHMQIRRQSKLSYDDPKRNPTIFKILIPIFVLLLLLVIGWFIAGHVIVLEVKLIVELFDPVLPEYCPGNLYKPAYIFIFVDYLIFLTAILLNASSLKTPTSNDTNKKTPPRLVRPTPK